METVVALWNAPHRIILHIITQANSAWASIGPGQSPTLPQHNLWVAFNRGLIQAQNHHHRLIRVIITITISITTTTTNAAVDAAVGGLDADASIGGEHDGGNEDKNANRNGNAVAEARASR